MMKESQGQDRMRRPPFMPDKDAKQNDTRADERGLHQPDFPSPRSTNAHIKLLPPAPARSAPAKSNRPTLCPILSCIPAITRNPATMAIGTLIRKAQRHETCVTISVPRSGPATLATAHALLAAPNALPRLLGG